MQFMVKAKKANKSLLIIRLKVQVIKLVPTALADFIFSKVSIGLYLCCIVCSFNISTAILSKLFTCCCVRHIPYLFHFHLFPQMFSLNTV